MHTQLYYKLRWSGREAGNEASRPTFRREGMKECSQPGRQESRNAGRCLGEQGSGAYQLERQGGASALREVGTLK